MQLMMFYSTPVEPTMCKGFAQSPVLHPTPPSPQEGAFIYILYIYMRRDNFIHHCTWLLLFFLLNDRLQALGFS